LATAEYTDEMDVGGKISVLSTDCETRGLFAAFFNVVSGACEMPVKIDRMPKPRFFVTESPGGGCCGIRLPLLNPGDPIVNPRPVA
jgi:hypothetical protein